jgi:hypothetical protein
MAHYIMKEKRLCRHAPPGGWQRIAAIHAEAI